MKKIFLLLTVLPFNFCMAQNIGINSTGAAPVASAMLDILASDKGLLIPRVALTATNATGPVTSPATSLLVYNTATAGSSPNNVIPGYYYWNSTAWIALLNSTSNLNAWNAIGNSGTTAGTNFIGTTDNIDFVVKTNNSEVTRFTSAGNVGVGTSPSFKFDVNGAIRTGKSSTTNGSLAFSNSTNANTLTLNSGVTSTTYALTLPVAQGGANTMMTNDGTGVLTWTTPAAAGSAWALNGNSTTLKTLGTITNIDLPFITNNVERMRINNAGNIGIGTSTFDGTNPEKLLVNSGVTTSVNSIVGKGSINSYLQLNIQNQSAGTSASSDVVATADNGNETTNYVDMGINSSTNTSGVMGGADDAYLYNVGQNFLLGTGTAAKSLVLMTGGTSQATNERMRIDGTGNVGIGVNTIPKASTGAAKLAIEGASGSMNGPHVQFTTAADNYPLISILPWTHDNSYFLFDAYWDGSTWRSSTTTGGNFRWQKSGGWLELGYANVNSQGGAISAFSPGVILNNTGSVGLGTSTFNATNPEKLVVDAGTTTSVNSIVGKGSINNYLQLNIQNQSAGASASSDVVATADNGSETTNFVDMGINSSANTSGVMGGANDAYLYNIGQNFLLGTGTAAKSLVFMTGGTAQAVNERMRIDGTGKIGIGNNNPNSTLSVTGSVAMTFRSGSGAYTLLTTDYAIINTGSAATWTLPAASSCSGRIHRLINQGTGSITLSQSVTTASGVTTTTLSVATNFEVISDGSVWRKIN